MTDLENYGFIEQVNELGGELDEQDIVFKSKQLKRAYELGWKQCSENHVPKYKIREKANIWKEYGEELLEVVDSKEDPSHQFAVAHINNAEALLGDVLDES